ncbi:MAG TPA: hypothetical protein VLJ68_01070 [Chitinophagaceae bacterium]|nr:hypothetical protein [Chitinophagaceae bacterium]
MHKRILCFCLAFLAIHPVLRAQFKKGMRMVGASVGTGTYNIGNSDVTYPSVTGFSSKENSYLLSFSPMMGWFISDNTVIGGSLLLNPNGSKSRYMSTGSTFQQDKVNTFNVGLGGFARNYFKSSGSMMPFGQGNLNLGVSSKNSSGFFYGGSGSSVYKTTYEGKSSSGFFANVTLSLGITKELNPNTGFDLFVSYTYSYSKNTMKTTTLRDDGNNGSVDLTSVNEPTTKFTNHGFSIGVAYQIFLDAKK